MLRRQSKNTMNGLDLMDDKKKHEDLEDGNYIRKWFIEGRCSSKIWRERSSKACCFDQKCENNY